MKLGKITIAAVGKIKKEHWRSAQADYIKRLGRYTALSLAEVRDYVGKGSPDHVALQKEGSALLAATKNVRFKIALSIEGRQESSLQFANGPRTMVN